MSDQTQPLSNPVSTMELNDALAVLAASRGAAIIVSTIDYQLEAFAEGKPGAFDFCYEPCSLGGGPLLALGLAVARPDRNVIALLTETELLANLNCLVTILASGATNLTLVALSMPPKVELRPSAFVRGHPPDRLANIARAAGLVGVSHFDELASWRDHAQQTLNAPAPRLIQLYVTAHPRPHAKTTSDEMAQRIERLRQVLAT